MMVQRKGITGKRGAGFCFRRCGPFPDLDVETSSGLYGRQDIRMVSTRRMPLCPLIAGA